MKLFHSIQRVFVLLFASGCLSSVAPGGDGSQRAPCTPAKDDTTVVAPPDSLLTAPIYYGRKEKGFDKTLQNYILPCADSAAVPPSLMPLWRNMQKLRNSNTLIGPLLYERAEDLDIYYGFSAQKGTDGLWSSYYGTVRVDNDKKYSDEYRLLCQAHETLHGVQNATGTIGKNDAWTIWDMQRACMSTESAALTCEYLLALEFYHDSIPDYINQSQDFSAPLRKRLIDELTAANADSLPHDQDLANIGVKEFYGVFKKQWWLDFYNNWTLDFYLSHLQEGWLKKPDGTGYGIDMVRKSGYLSDDFNFTAGVDSLPSNLFGTNTRMKQAFDYAECVRLGSTLGAGDPLYLTRLAELKKDKNPYLGIDLLAVYAKAQKSGKPVFEVLENAAKHPLLHPFLQYSPRKMAPF